MKIIIVGIGKVGYAIAEQMTGENHDLVIVDQSSAVLDHADSMLDVMCVEGNGASASVLLQAGVREADLLIAVSENDEVNLICCLMAKNSARSTPSPACETLNISATHPSCAARSALI